MRHILKRIRAVKDRNEGAVALEFALLGPMLFLLIIALLEMGLLITRTVLLDDAVSQASRFMYTGAASDGRVSREDLTAFICENSRIIYDCERNLELDATVITNFTTPPDNDAPCRDSADAEFEPVSSFTPGGGSEIVLLRVCATVDLLVPWYGLSPHLTQTDTGRVQIISSLAFSNEPF